MIAHSAGAGGGPQGELIEGEDLAPRLQDAGAGGLSGLEARDLELGDLVEAHVVRDGANHNRNLLLLGEENFVCEVAEAECCLPCQDCEKSARLPKEAQDV